MKYIQTKILQYGEFNRITKGGTMVKRIICIVVVWIFIAGVSQASHDERKDKLREDIKLIELRIGEKHKEIQQLTQLGQQKVGAYNLLLELDKDEKKPDEA